MPLVTPDEQAEVERCIDEAACPTRSFLILMVLSTLIASYGLLSNSTATVIGAMIVAPLMGPILGLALSVVQGRMDRFGRALQAEILGVLLCVLTALVVALLAGSENIDYGQSEIAGRTHPTLYDLMVGLAAGMAGGYASAHRKVGSSIAGVAIAVALVPPLSVTGLGLAGVWQGVVGWSIPLGSFVLFLANFLTIELASATVFALAGLGSLHHVKRSRGLLGGIWVQLLLLAATLYFLWGQLDAVMQHRRLERQTRTLLQAELTRLPGVGMESLELVKRGPRTVVKLFVRSPQEIPVGQVANLQEKLSNELAGDVELVLGTILSTYYSTRGRLYAPEGQPPSPQEILLQQLDLSLVAALHGFPGVELVSFRLLESPPATIRALVTVRSAYELDAQLVTRLQTAAQAALGRNEKLELTVRTVLSRDFTASGPVETVAERRIDPEQARRDDLRRMLDSELRTLVAELPDSLLVSLSFTVGPLPGSDGSPGPTPIPLDSPADTAPWEALQVEATVRTARPLSPAQVALWQERLHQRLQIAVKLRVDNRLGATVLPLPDR
ncbi:DUF389 domain-containing protein [bacterium CPR1]|nr:DUF389 domain-containing protein [bacterium CPR1]